MSSSLDGLHPDLMRPRVQAVLGDPEAAALGLYVVSAFRPIEKQRQLFVAAVKKYGSETAAGKWVAPPGRSNHGPTLDDAGHKVADQARHGRWGSAVDFGIPGFTAVSGQWPADIEAGVNAVCARHGLASPLEWEDWHFEPIAGWDPPTSPSSQEALLMTAAKDDHDARWALVLQWFVDYLGRPPASTQEHDLHVAVFAKDGAGACLSGIVNSAEAGGLRQRRGW